MFEVVEIRDEDESAWDEYVRCSQTGTPFHLFGWKRVMETTYGYRSHYLMAKEGGRIEGVLPLFVIRSRLVGDYVTTLPRGLCTEKAEAARMLVERAREIAITADTRYLVIRDSPRKWDFDLVSVEGHCTAIRDLPIKVEAAWKSLNRDTRRQVRLARKNDLQVSVGRGGECLDDFYDHFSKLVRDAGTPVFGKQFFRSIVEELPDSPIIIVVRQQGEVLAAYWALTLGCVIFGLWGGCTRKYLSWGTEYLGYWEHMRYGCEHGYKQVDFGRCLKGSGHYLFKKRWASRFRALYRHYLLNGAKTPPRHFGACEGEAEVSIFHLLLEEAASPGYSACRSTDTSAHAVRLSGSFCILRFRHRPHIRLTARVEILRVSCVIGMANDPVLSWGQKWLGW